MAKVRTVKEFADQVRKSFYQKDDKWFAKNEKADALVREVHEVLDLFPMPDDTTFNEIIKALDAIVDADGDLDDAMMYYAEPDIYNSDRLRWFNEFPKAIEFVDRAREFYGHSESIIDDIGAGQHLMRQQILDVVHRFLESNLDLDDYDDDDDPSGE